VRRGRSGLPLTRRAHERRDDAVFSGESEVQGDFDSSIRRNEGHTQRSWPVVPQARLVGDGGWHETKFAGQEAEVLGNLLGEGPLSDVHRAIVTDNRFRLARGARECDHSSTGVTPPQHGAQSCSQAQPTVSWPWGLSNLWAAPDPGPAVPRRRVDTGRTDGILGGSSA